MSQSVFPSLTCVLSTDQVMINNGFTPDREDYEFCTKVDNMVIPTEGFFGISAATGGLAGNLSSLRLRKKSVSFMLFFRQLLNILTFDCSLIQEQKHDCKKHLIIF